MQRFSAQDITYTNYKEKLHSVIKSCKQHESTLKYGGIQPVKRSLSQSNSGEHLGASSSIMAAKAKLKKDNWENRKGKNLSINTQPQICSDQITLKSTSKTTASKTRSNSFASQQQQYNSILGAQSVQNKNSKKKQVIGMISNKNQFSGSKNISYVPSQPGITENFDNFSEFFNRKNNKDNKGDINSPMKQIQELREKLLRRDMSQESHQQKEEMIQNHRQNDDQNIYINQGDCRDEQQILVSSESVLQFEGSRFGSNQKEKEMNQDIRIQIYQDQVAYNSNFTPQNVLEIQDERRLENELQHSPQANLLARFEDAHETPVESKIQCNQITFCALERAQKVEPLGGKKIIVPKIKNFDAMVVEKNEQMEYEIPPHVYNQTFESDDCESSSCSMRESMNQSVSEKQQHLLEDIHPVQGLRSMVKAMEGCGKESDQMEVKTLKTTIRKLQYRDAVLRQKIAQMTTMLKDKEDKQQQDEELMQNIREQMEEKDKKIEEMMHLIAFKTAAWEQLEREKSKEKKEDKKESEKEQIIALKKEYEAKMSAQELNCLERLADFQQRSLDLESKCQVLSQQKDEISNQLKVERESRLCLEEVLKNYLLTREIEKLKNGPKKGDEEGEGEADDDDDEEIEIGDEQIYGVHSGFQSVNGKSNCSTKMQQLQKLREAFPNNKFQLQQVQQPHTHGMQFTENTRLSGNKNNISEKITTNVTCNDTNSAVKPNQNISNTNFLISITDVSGISLLNPLVNNPNNCPDQSVSSSFSSAIGRENSSTFLKEVDMNLNSNGSSGNNRNQIEINKKNIIVSKQMQQAQQHQYQMAQQFTLNTSGLTSLSPHKNIPPSSKLNFISSHIGKENDVPSRLSSASQPKKINQLLILSQNLSSSQKDNQEVFGRKSENIQISTQQNEQQYQQTR